MLISWILASENFLSDDNSIKNLFKWPLKGSQKMFKRTDVLQKEILIGLFVWRMYKNFQKIRLFPHLSQIYTSFTMMRFLPLLAFAAMAFAECPAPKQCADDEYPCTGPYDEKTGCYTYDTCMPYKDQYGCPST